MTIELHPVGIRCNLACPYCYQNPMRDAGNFGTEGYDLEKMKAGLAAEGGAFTVFGGEALLMPIDDLEDLWSWGFERNGRNGIQTNGALITERHFEMFKKYKVGVGVSMDGPEELNDSRWAGSLEKTRAATVKSQANLERLCRDGCYTYNDGSKSGPSLIITIYKGNADPDKRPRLKEWIKHLDAIGIQAVRLHPLEIDNDQVREDWAMSVDEQIDFFLDMAQFEVELSTVRFDLFKDERILLAGNDGGATCVWNACDPWTTDAVRGVGPDGSRMNCGRTAKEGVNWGKAEAKGYERQLALYNTPFEAGGCSGCRFFIMCKGQCPGTGLENDWRNRTESCGLIMATFEHFEREMVRDQKRPLSLAPERPELERIMLNAWGNGRNLRIYEAVKIQKGQMVAPGAGVRGDYGDDHGDHWDNENPVHQDDATETGGREHADQEHGDYTDHGDSEDPNHTDHSDG